MYWASGIAKALEVRWPDFSYFSETDSSNSIDSSEYEEELVEDTAHKLSVSVKDPSKKIIKLKRNKSGNLFVTITKESIQLWIFRPTALVSQVTRTEKSLAEYGENNDVYWKPDGTLIIVQTDQNCLFTYNVMPLDDKSYKYQFGNVPHHYTTGVGEGNGIKTFLLKFRMTIRIDAGTEEYLIVTTKNPTAIQCIPWNGDPSATKTNILARLEFLENKKSGIKFIIYDRRINLYGWVTTDGKSYAVQFNEHQSSVSKHPLLYWLGYCFHGSGEAAPEKDAKATCIAINAKFALLAVGTEGFILKFFLKNIYKNNITSLTSKTPNSTGPVTSLSWTSDGHAIAVGWQNEGLAIWSVYGKLLMTTIRDDWPNSIPNNQDKFLNGVNDLDNAKRGFLQMDDRLLLYRGGDQEDLSAINPDTIVWQHIPYASINGEGRYIAIAGRRGLAHYNVTSGRWKLFGNQQQEQEFAVRGGLLWYKDILVAACKNVQTHTYEIRMYSREKNLDNIHMIENVKISSNILYLSIVDNALLVYCGDNMMYHYLINSPTTAQEFAELNGTTRLVSLELCQQISFIGVIHAPTRVRSISWFQPKVHRPFTPDTIQSASIIFLIDGKLVLLHPKKSNEGEVQYDLHILADKIEFYWMSTKGIGSLKNSLWACDGQGIRIWMNIWSNEESARDWHNDVLMSATVLLDKGIIVGVQQQMSIRLSLDYTVFKLMTNTHLFLQHILRYMLTKELEEESIAFATSYQRLVYFGHALEMLLHQVLEDEAEHPNETAQAVLPRVVKFINTFPHSLDAIVACARKTEVALWSYLFSIVGSPKDLYEKCMSTGLLKTATSYLLVIHTLEPTADSGKDTMRLLSKAMESDDYELCKELVRFLNSIDGTGKLLKDALETIEISFKNKDDAIKSSLLPSSKPLTHNYTDGSENVWAA
ncbi:9346_t:CDS:10 [Entrophospora sp. SA101]|nr:9346_t:CDS:10 [Entrophospora sp. SA101]